MKFMGSTPGPTSQDLPRGGGGGRAQDPDFTSLPGGSHRQHLGEAQARVCKLLCSHRRASLGCVNENLQVPGEKK